MVTMDMNDPLLEAISAARAPHETAMANAQQQWDRLMDAPGLLDPMGGYRVLNIHYPQIDERLGCVACVHCGTEWPCPPFAELEAKERPSA